ncbi:Uncharacterized protein APZ42_031505 [Daphnia magna]|uniref:Uncharacterized protein n=1 Tax=Daphnia magna TaxID=35525 RepID=A0A164MT54_9CRUS|nr:Uncharacterized protein APZ42_031505 [Daphnia magna]
MKWQRCRKLHCGECAPENASHCANKCIALCKKVYRAVGCHRSGSTYLARQVFSNPKTINTGL